jgi:hypothetical protein
MGEGMCRSGMSCTIAEIGCGRVGLLEGSGSERWLFDGCDARGLQGVESLGVAMGRFAQKMRRRWERKRCTRSCMG